MHIPLASLLTYSLLYLAIAWWKPLCCTNEEEAPVEAFKAKVTNKDQSGQVLKKSDMIRVALRKKSQLRGFLLITNEVFGSEAATVASRFKNSVDKEVNSYQTTVIGLAPGLVPFLVMALKLDYRSFCQFTS